MIHTKRKDPFSGHLIAAGGLIYAHLLISGAQWIFAATAILGTEVVTITEIGIERVAVFFGA
jgi:hypothetical protein